MHLMYKVSAVKKVEDKEVGAHLKSNWGFVADLSEAEKQKKLPPGHPFREHPATKPVERAAKKAK